MATAFHQEALRKQRIIERKHLALARQKQEGVTKQRFNTQKKDLTNECGPMKSSVNYRDVGDTRRNMDLAQPINKPALFRVQNKDGYYNRYRSHSPPMPHVDQMYRIMYPADRNYAYTTDNKLNLGIQLRARDREAIQRRINGDFHMNVLAAQNAIS